LGSPGRGNGPDRERHGTHERRSVNVNYGVRSLLLLLAALLFILAVFDEGNWDDYIAFGLTSFALSFLLADLGWDRRYGSSQR
jgi:hypothetical protein